MKKYTILLIILILVIGCKSPRRGSLTPQEFLFNNQQYLVVLNGEKDGYNKYVGKQLVIKVSDIVGIYNKDEKGGYNLISEVLATNEYQQFKDTNVWAKAEKEKG